jgi:arylsulfatase A-like enzyme
MNVDGETILGDSYASHNLTERATGFISSTPTTDPLFLLLTPFVPHAPAVPEPAYERSFDHLEPHRNDAVNETDVTDKPKWVRQLPELTTSQLAAFDGRRERQFESLLSTDDLVDDVMTTLTDTGRLEDTLVVFMSDNGFLWNEHRIWGKGAAYDASARVPLAMYVPAALGEIRTPDDMILNIDIAPTAAALAGVAPSRPVDGESFLGRLDGTDASWRPTTIVEHASGGGPPAYCAARSAQGLFVHYDTGEEEFYDYRRDPLELRNRARASPPAMQPLESFARRTCGPGSDAEIPGFSW